MNRRVLVVLPAAAAAAFLCVLFACPDSKVNPSSSDAGALATPEPAQKKAIDPATTATVAGVVTFSGTPPAPTMLTVSSADCQQAHPKEFSADDVKVNGGKVEDAFVWVKSGLAGYAFPPPNGAVEVDQKGCMYHPRILGARAGQDIEFKNSDATLHNISSKPVAQSGWNFVTPQGASGKRSFKKPEVPVKIGCDVHPWMKAYVAVVDHPFFKVTGPDGSFSFAGLPPGTYTIAAWHERLGSTEQQLTVAANEKKDVALEFPPAAR